MSPASKAPYTIGYHKDALDYLDTTEKKFRNQIIKKIDALAINPLGPGPNLIHGITYGTERVYRIRSGDYRVLYIVRHDLGQITVLDIDHRKDIYR